MPTTRPQIKLNNIYCIIPEDKLSNYLLSAGINKINSFCVKAGVDYSIGRFLISGSDITSLPPENISVTFSEVADDPANNVQFSYTNLCLIDVDLLMTPLEATESLYIVTVADSRYRSHKQFLGVNHSLFPTTNPNNQHPDAQTTWEDVVDSYRTLASLVESIDQTEAFYPSTLMKDVRFNEPMGAWQTINHVLDLIGHTIYHQRNATSNFRVLPLSRSFLSNSDLLNEPNNQAALIQKKCSREYVINSISPSDIRVSFPPERISGDSLELTLHTTL